MTLRVESFRSGSYMIIIIQNFTLVSLTSIIIPHLVGLPLGAAVSSFPTHSSLYALNVLPLRLYISQKNIPFRYLFEIVYLLQRTVCHPQSSHYVAKKLNCWLNAIIAPFLCDSQPHH